ncbi:uncharacterized protein PG986_006227 [Apiospora aurea]|uniref:Uncharacterized protein n=1 Tax=Apiospora aurea TaxID=335848 RepID=A0ABR1QJS8_9PEZI
MHAFTTKFIFTTTFSVISRRISSSVTRGNMEEHGMMPLPDGEAQNFHGTTHLQILIIIVASVTFTFATVLLMLRIYTSAKIVKKLEVSDCEYRFIRFIAFGTLFWNSISKIASPAVLIAFSWGLSGSYFTGMVLCKLSPG